MKLHNVFNLTILKVFTLTSANVLATLNIANIIHDPLNLHAKIKIVHVRNRQFNKIVFKFQAAHENSLSRLEKFHDSIILLSLQREIPTI